MDPTPSLAQFVQHIIPRGRLIRAWPLTGGISAGMTALEVEAPGGMRSKMVLRRPGEANLRQNPRAAEDEYHLLRGLHARGLAVAQPLYLAAPGEVFDTACLVLEYVEGQVDFAPASVEEYTRQLAAELARIHRVRCSPPDCPALPPGREIFAGLMAQRPARLNDDLEEGRIRAALEAVWPMLHVGRSDNAHSHEGYHDAPGAALGDSPGNASGKSSGSGPGNQSGNGPGNQPGNAPGNVSNHAPGSAPSRATALLHGDFWPGNVLWREGRLAAVIDWEDAAVGDPLIDVAIARLDLLWIIGREAMDSFTRHYLAESGVDATRLPWWDLCAALRLLRMAGGDLVGWAAFFHPYGRQDITADTIRENLRFFNAQALERVASLGDKSTFF